MSKNDITGDKLVSKPSTAYGTGWELIWRKDKELEQDIRVTNKPRQCVIYPDPPEEETCK